MRTCQLCGRNAIQSPVSRTWVHSDDAGIPVIVTDHLPYVLLDDIDPAPMAILESIAAQDDSQVRALTLAAAAGIVRAARVEGDLATVADAVLETAEELLAWVYAPMTAAAEFPEGRWHPSLLPSEHREA